MSSDFKAKEEEVLVEINWFEEEGSVSTLNATEYLSQFGIYTSGKEENGMIVTKSDFNPADNKEKGVQGETVIIAVIVGGVVVAIIIFIGCYYMWKCRNNRSQFVSIEKRRCKVWKGLKNKCDKVSERMKLAAKNIKKISKKRYKTRLDDLDSYENHSDLNYLNTDKFYSVDETTGKKNITFHTLHKEPMGQPAYSSTPANNAAPERATNAIMNSFKPAKVSSRIKHDGAKQQGKRQSDGTSLENNSSRATLRQAVRRPQVPPPGRAVVIRPPVLRLDQQNLADQHKTLLSPQSHQGSYLSSGENVRNDLACSLFKGAKDPVAVANALWHEVDSTGGRDPNRPENNDAAEFSHPNNCSLKVKAEIHRHSVEENDPDGDNNGEVFTTVPAPVEQSVVSVKDQHAQEHEIIDLSEKEVMFGKVMSGNPEAQDDTINENPSIMPTAAVAGISDPMGYRNKKVASDSESENDAKSSDGDSRFGLYD